MAATLSRQRPRCKEIGIVSLDFPIHLRPRIINPERDHQPRLRPCPRISTVARSSIPVLDPDASFSLAGDHGQARAQIQPRTPDSSCTRALKKARRLIGSSLPNPIEADVCHHLGDAFKTIERSAKLAFGLTSLPVPMFPTDAIDDQRFNFVQG